MSKDRKSRPESSWRLFWLGMLVLHGPVTVSVSSDLWRDGASGAWTSFLLLFISSLFFLFELVFASTLRLFSNRHTAVVLLLVVAILHVGVVERSFTGTVHEHSIPFWLTVAVIGTNAGQIQWRRLAAHSWTPANADLHRRLGRMRLSRNLATEPIPMRRWPLCNWPSTLTRAPPFFP